MTVLTQIRPRPSEIDPIRDIKRFFQNEVTGGVILRNYWYKPGISGTFGAYMQTTSGGGGFISSTAHATKGFVYLGSALTSAFDETNQRLGLNRAAPSAKLHMQVAAPAGQEPAMTAASEVFGSGSAPVGGTPNTLLQCLSNSSTADFLRYTENGFNSQVAADFAAISNPGVTSGFSFSVNMRGVDAIDGRVNILVNNASGGSAIVNAFWGIGNGNTNTTGDFQGNITSSFAQYSYVLSAAQVALINFASHVVITVASSVPLVSSGLMRYEVAFLDFDAPAIGGGSAETLQTWQTPSYDDSLDFTADGSAGMTLDLTLSGDSPFRISAGGGTSGLRILTSSTDGRLEAGTAAAANMNLVLSGARATTGTLATVDFTTTLLKGALRFEDPGAGTNYVAITAPTTPTTHTYTLPTAQGAASTLLQNNGSGALSWVTHSSIVDIARTWTTLQTFPDTTIRIVDDGDNTKVFQWQLSSATTGTTTTLQVSQSVNRTVTLPDITTTLMGLAGAQVVSGNKTFRTGAAAAALVAEANGSLSHAAVELLEATTQLNIELFFPTAGLLANRDWTLPDAGGTPLLWSTLGTLPAAGNLVYGAGANTGMSALAIGVSGTILTSTGSAPQWSTNASIVDIARTWTTLQTFPDNTIKIVGSAVSTKVALFELDGSTAGKTLTLDLRTDNDRSLILALTGATGFNLTLAWNGTASRTLTFPNATGAVACYNLPQTWTEIQTFDTTLGAVPVFNQDLSSGNSFINVFDTSSLFTVGLSFTGSPSSDSNLVFPTGGTVVTTIAAQTLSNKTLQTNCFMICNTASSGIPLTDSTNNNKKMRFVVSGLSASAAHSVQFTGTAVRTWTFRDLDGGVVLDAGAALTSGRVPFATTGGALTDDLDMTFATDTLTVTKLVVGGGASNSKIDNGTYTPTLTNAANLAASTAYQCQYIQVGATVTVSGKVDVDPTLTATATQLGISLPVASNLGAEEDCAGTAFASGISGQGAAIRGDATNNRAEMVWIATDITNQPMYFTFTYQVI